MIFGRSIEYKSRQELLLMKEAGLVTAVALAAAREAAVPGATTADVDAAGAKAIAEAGATSNFLGYQGFPATLCVSANDEVVHGIPGGRVLEAGDLLSIDGGAIVGGFHGDSACTIVVGGREAGSAEDLRLSDVTEEALWVGIAAFAGATRVGEIGDAIDDYVSDADPALGILQDYVGHGIGTEMHQAPDVFNYRTGRSGAKVKDGMCLAIEPMLVAGDTETYVADDDWTVATSDGKRAAHWEHSVARHSGGIWVLTAPDGGASRLERYGVTPVPI